MKRNLILPLLSLIFVRFYGQEISCNPDLNERSRIVAENIPNNYTCYMEMTRGRSSRYGTGFLIHPRVILSAGHNFAWYPNGHVNTVKVYFGSIDSVTYLIGDTLLLKKDKNKFFKSGYWIKGNISRDYSIIILPDSTLYKKVKGHYKLPNSSIISEIKSINITGSPGDTSLFQMWTSHTENFSIDSNYMIYDLHTEVRNSGSPIWSKIGNDYFATGVHSRSMGNCNAAVLLNNEVVTQIKSWCKSAGINIE